MCGICVCLYRSRTELSSVEDSDLDNALKQLEARNATRGPDRQNTVRRRIFPSRLSESETKDREELILHCFASALQLRGSTAVTQPYVRNDDFLCWNGEVFDGLKVADNENDGATLFQELCTTNSAEIEAMFGKIEGPYAFVFYHAQSRSLYFGRDPLGRRSLLVAWPTVHRPYFILSSVSAGIDNDLLSFEELDTGSLYCLHLPDLCTEKELFSGFKDKVRKLRRTPQSPHMGLPYAVPAPVNRALPEEVAPPEIYSLDSVPDYLKPSVDRLLVELDKSVRLQVQSIPQRNPGEARLAILFSGGIDSTALCYLANRHIPKEEPIDLLNVAFENPRKIRVQLEGNPDGQPKHVKRERRKQELNNHTMLQHDTSYMVPDRVSGLEELEELRRICPGRTWNFVEINVPYEETRRAKMAVESIMFPSRTVMDLSLALALWFASRGIGVVKATPIAESVPYASRARVLLNGLGSDELLGGYGRHRAAFNTGGWHAVIDELQLEIDRIPTRNLGRDDRIISSHGKETRHPFLSLDVVRFLAELPVQHKVDPRLKVGLGDKMLLRFAMKKVGLELASARKKRAMQFGSHSARMEGERRGDIPLD